MAPAKHILRAMLRGAVPCAVVSVLLMGSVGEGWAGQAPAKPSQAKVQFEHQTATLITQSGTRHLLAIELAKSEAQRMHGLMFRDNLPEGTGMLFDFQAPLVVRMWMKNTLIPLDMLFFDRAGRVVGMVQNAQPGDLTPVGPDQPVIAVLELPGGQAARWGLKVGDRLDHPMFSAALGQEKPF